MTRYEQAKAKLAQLEEERAKVEGELAEAEEKAAQALLRGERPGPIDPALGQRLRVLDRAITLARKEVADLEREDLKRRLGEIEKEKQKLASELGKAREVYEAAKKEFQKAEHRFGATHLRITHALDRLTDEELKIRARLETPQAEEAPREVDPARVQAILQDFREGRIRNYMAGQDVNADEAYRLYQKEIAEIQAWHREDEVSRRVRGVGVDPPACAAYYTEQRLQEILAKGKPKGGLAAPAKAEGGPALRPQKVSI